MGPRRVDFRRFFEKPDFLKIELSMVIWPHFEGRTLQKSVPRATPNGNGEKNRQKSLPAPSPDALFRFRARFLSILGSRPGPKIAPKPPPAKKSTGILAAGNRFFTFSSLGCVPEGSRTDSGGSGDPPGLDFGQSFRWFAGFRRGVAGFHR